MAYYTASVEKLDKSVCTLIQQQDYPVVQSNPLLYEVQEVRLKNAEQLAFYENEVRCIDMALERAQAILDSVGVIELCKGDSDDNIRLQVKNFANPRQCPSWDAPLSRLERTHGEAYQILCHYMSRLNQRIPAYSSVTEMENFLSFLVERKASSKKQLAGLQKGKTGEERVGKMLEKLAFKSIIRQSVILPAMTADSETSETDAIVITPKGVFVLEVKNIGSTSETINIELDGRWQRVKNNRVIKTYGTKGNFDRSPSEQNIIHKVNIQAFLAKHGMENVELIPAVVIANNDVSIENASKNVVIRYNELVTFIEAYEAPSVLTQQQMEQIAQLFDTYGMEERTFPVTGLASSCDELLGYLDYLKSVFLKQKQIEMTIGQMLQNAVQDVFAAKAEMEAAQEQEQEAAKKQTIQKSTKIGVKLVKTVIVNLVRLFIAMRLEYNLRTDILYSDWFKFLIKNVANPDTLEIENQAITNTIHVAVYVFLWIAVWLVPHLIWQVVKNRSIGYLVNAAVHLAVVVAGCFGIMYVLGIGYWHLALAGFALLLLLCWRIWYGKFLVGKLKR